MSSQRITANSRADLESYLGDWRPKVAPRGKGRSKEQTEPWVSRRFLLAALRFDLLRYPMVAESGDKPDLLLAQGGALIGIEITEMVPPALAQAEVIARQYFPEAIIDRSIFRWGVHFTPQQIHEHLAQATKLTGPGWDGDSVEREWAGAVSDTISLKTIKLNKPGYRSADSYWLVAYASAPGPALDLATAIKFLSPLSCSGDDRRFDAAILLTDESAVHLSHVGVISLAEGIGDLVK